MRKAIVYCHDTKAGLLEESTPGRGYTFTYDKQYMMDRTHDPVSLTMPFREAPINLIIYSRFHQYASRRSKQKDSLQKLAIGREGFLWTSSEDSNP